jgi:hypothetical protein
LFLLFLFLRTYVRIGRIMMIMIAYGEIETTSTTMHVDVVAKVD